MSPIKLHHWSSLREFLCKVSNEHARSRMRTHSQSFCHREPMSPPWTDSAGVVHSLDFGGLQQRGHFPLHVALLRKFPTRRGCGGEVYRARSPAVSGLIVRLGQTTPAPSTSPAGQRNTLLPVSIGKSDLFFTRGKKFVSRVPRGHSGAHSWRLPPYRSQKPSAYRGA
jgi:hypothetical protein